MRSDVAFEVTATDSRSWRQGPGARLTGTETQTRSFTSKGVGALYEVTGSAKAWR
jgi:hypothetical protein